MERADVERSLGVEFPPAIRRLYEAGDGRFNPAGQWWVIWPLDRVAVEAPLAWQNGMPQSLVPFGDDGSGSPFCLDTTASPTQVVRWNWIDGEAEGSEGDVASFVAVWVESQ